MIKLVAGGLLCVASGYVGIQIERIYRKRAAFFEDFLCYLEYAKSQISTLKTPVVEIMDAFLTERAGKSEFCEMLEKVRYTLRTEGGRKEIADISSVALKKADIKLFSDYFSNCGKLPLADELHYLDAHSDILREKLKLSKQDIDKKGKTTFKLSVALGLFLLIVLC